MTSQHDKAKRWRPRFSVRTLVVVVALVCVVSGWITWPQRTLSRFHRLLRDGRLEEARSMTTFANGWTLDEAGDDGVYATYPYGASVRVDQQMVHAQPRTFKDILLARQIFPYFGGRIVVIVQQGKICVRDRERRD